MKKSIFKSKTFWINVLMMLAVVLPDLFNLEAVKVSPEISAFVILVVNVILRFMTTGSVGLKGDKKEG